MSRVVEEPEMSDGSPLPARMYRLAWTLHKRVVMWIKAVSSLMLVIAGTVTQTYGLADLQGYAKTLFGDSVKLPAIVGGITVAYLLSTILLKLPKGFSGNIKQDDGD
jgi:hypothetical protein